MSSEQHVRHDWDRYQDKLTHLAGDCGLGVGEEDTEHWISSNCRRIVSASAAIWDWSEGGGMLTNCEHLPENSSPGSAGRLLVLVTFLGILLTLTSWLNLTWRDSDTVECSDLREGDRFTCNKKIFGNNLLYLSNFKMYFVYLWSCKEFANVFSTTQNNLKRFWTSCGVVKHFWHGKKLVKGK